MLKPLKATFVSCFILSLCIQVHAYTIKMGTIAPDGSPWSKALKKISSEWNNISDGKINIKIYDGGIAGDEEDMLRKMRIGQLHAAALSGVGFVRIYNGVLALQLPMLIRNDKELYYVLEKLKDHYESKIKKEGFIVLAWSKVGWVHFFSKNPVVTPDDLREHKLFTYEGDPAGVQAWKKAGFNPVPLSPNDLMTSLKSGMVNAFTTTPLSAAAYQWFGLAKNMCGMKWAPLTGGIVISKRAWNRIPENLRPELKKACQRIGQEMQAAIDSADAQAIEVMKKNGLKISNIPPETVKLWKRSAKKSYEALIGKSFDRKSYELVKKYVNEYREQHE